MRPNYWSVTVALVLALLFASVPGLRVSAQDYLVSIQVTEYAVAGTDVFFYASVREAGKTISGASVTFIVGGTSVGSCITDSAGTCRSGYKFDTPGVYIVTAIAGNGSATDTIVITPPPTPTGTNTPDPRTPATPTLPANFLLTATIVYPTVNIPTSTPTVEAILLFPSRTPSGPTATLPPTKTRTPAPAVALPTYDPGYTPTPAPPTDNTRPIVNGLTVLAVFLGIGGTIFTIYRVRKFRQLTKNRNKR